MTNEELMEKIKKAREKSDTLATVKEVRITPNQDQRDTRDDIIKDDDYLEVWNGPHYIDASEEQLTEINGKVQTMISEIDKIKANVRQLSKMAEDISRDILYIISIG